MRNATRLFPALLLCSAVAGNALAQETAPGTSVTTGSESVLVDGKPAKRAGDIPGAILSPNVIINGQPVVIGCSEGTPVFSPDVMINGQPKIVDCQK